MICFDGLPGRNAGAQQRRPLIKVTPTSRAPLMRLGSIAWLSAWAAIQLIGVSNAASSQELAASSQLRSLGTLAICADPPVTPTHYYDESGKLVGSDVDTAELLGAKLGLKIDWVPGVFATMIESLKSGKCDIILSGMFITADRRAQIDMIPYLNVGQVYLANAGTTAEMGDPVADPLAMCGYRVAVTNGSAQHARVQKLNEECTAAGKKTIRAIVTSKSAESLLQLRTNKADFYVADSPVGLYYSKVQPDKFVVKGSVFAPVQAGIGVAKGHPQLRDAVIGALQAIQREGLYKPVLEKWGQNPDYPAATG